MANIAAVVTIPVFGALSDRIGRRMLMAAYATFFQEQFPMRIRGTGFAVSQNIGLMIASFFRSIFTAIAPPGSANVPLTIGLTTLGICIVSAVATLMSSDTKGKSREDLEGLKEARPGVSRG